MRRVSLSLLLTGSSYQPSMYHYLKSYLSIYLGGWGGLGCPSTWPAPAISWAYLYHYLESIYLSRNLGGWGGSDCPSTWPALAICWAYITLESIYLSIYLGGWGGSGCPCTWPASAISWAYITIWSLSPGSGRSNLSLSWENYSNFLPRKGKFFWEKNLSPFAQIFSIFL